MTKSLDISCFKDKSVLILGDLILDRYLHVQTYRQSAEAPIPVYDVKSTTENLGGAGNVLANIRTMGGKPFLIAMGGKDYRQVTLNALLNGYDTLLIPSDRMSTVKTRIMLEDTQVTCFEKQDTRDMSPDEFKILQDKLPDILSDFSPDVVILQDYDRGFFTAENISYLLDLFHKNHIPVVVDPKYRNFHSYKNVSLFKPNLSELQQGLETTFSSYKSDDNVLSSLHLSIHADQYLITLSEDGLLYGNMHEHGRLPSYVKAMRDVSGAGDTVISAAALGIACKWPIESIAVVAIAAAAIACEHPGIYPVRAQEIESKLAT